MQTRSIARRSRSLSPAASSSASLPPSRRCPSSVAATAAGCSWISLVMKSSCPPRRAAATSQSMFNAVARASAPSRVVTRIEPGLSSASWSSSSANSCRVEPSRAGMSEARNDVPSPSPTIRGETRRAATTNSGSSACTAATAKEPRTFLSTARRPSARPRPPAISASTKWGSTSESVSDASTCPSATNMLGQLGVILDDAVVDERQSAGAVHMGMGVAGGRPAVGGPAGVADPSAASRGCVLTEQPQVAHRMGALGRPGPPQGVSGDEHHAGRVVSPVLQAAQPFEEQRQRVVDPGDSDDSAHVLRLLTSRGPPRPGRWGWTGPS